MQLSHKFDESFGARAETCARAQIEIVWSNNFGREEQRAAVPISNSIVIYFTRKPFLYGLPIHCS